MSEHGSMVVFLALTYFRTQELKVCFHRHSGISIAGVATTVGRTTVDKQCVRFKVNAGKLNAGGRKNSNLKLCDYNDLMLLVKKICLC
jgi:hypothetical protein